MFRKSPEVKTGLSGSEANRYKRRYEDGKASSFSRFFRTVAALTSFAALQAAACSCEPEIENRTLDAGGRDDIAEDGSRQQDQGRPDMPPVEPDAKLPDDMEPPDPDMNPSLPPDAGAPDAPQPDMPVEEPDAALPPPPDRDGDGVSDLDDNCPDHSNPSQADILDDDGIGDVCDNCPFHNNPMQIDQDEDDDGDVCDLCPTVAGDSCGSPFDDPEGDGVPTASDNCPFVPNPDQSDTDGDLVGDACDNCPDTANTFQTNVDGDFYGDDCDNCPAVSNNAQLDGDDDGEGDACDECPEDPTNLCNEPEPDAGVPDAGVAADAGTDAVSADASAPSDPCDDGIDCTVDRQDVDGTCHHEFTPPSCCTANAQCDDDDPCTTDFCDRASEACVNSPVFGCELPDAGVGDAGTPDAGAPDAGADAGMPLGPCDDDVECTPDFLDIEGVCHNVSNPPECCVASSQCDDEDPCTDDFCDTDSEACVNAPFPGCVAPPDAGVLSPDAEVPSPPCDDEIDCTADFQDVEGNCHNVPNPPSCCSANAQCDDDDPCTTDFCDRGTEECRNTPIFGCVPPAEPDAGS